MQLAGVGARRPPKLTKKYGVQILGREKSTGVSGFHQSGVALTIYLFIYCFLINGYPCGPEDLVDWDALGGVALEADGVEAVLPNLGEDLRGELLDGAEVGLVQDPGHEGHVHLRGSTAPPALA